MSLVPDGKDGELLEPGCGAGFSVGYFREVFTGYLGVDYSRELVELARGRILDDRVRFETKDIRDLNEDGKFDVVVMIGVLHHIDAMEEVMEVLVRQLKPGGWLVSNEPQGANPMVSGLRTLRARLDEGFSEDQIEVSEEQMKKLYLDAGLTNLLVAPQGIFSTPFAEVPMRPQWLISAMATIAVGADRIFESLPSSLLKGISWNLVVAGQWMGNEVA